MACQVVSLPKAALIYMEADVQLRYVEELRGIEENRSVLNFCKIYHLLVGMCRHNCSHFVRHRRWWSLQATAVGHSRHLYK